MNDIAATVAALTNKVQDAAKRYELSQPQAYSTATLSAIHKQATLPDNSVIQSQLQTIERLTSDLERKDELIRQMKVETEKLIIRHRNDIDQAKRISELEIERAVREATSATSAAVSTSDEIRTLKSLVDRAESESNAIRDRLKLCSNELDESRKNLNETKIQLEVAKTDLGIYKENQDKLIKQTESLELHKKNLEEQITNQRADLSSKLKSLSAKNSRVIELKNAESKRLEAEAASSKIGQVSVTSLALESHPSPIKGTPSRRVATSILKSPVRSIISLSQSQIAAAVPSTDEKKIIINGILIDVDVISHGIMQLIQDYRILTTLCLTFINKIGIAYPGQLVKEIQHSVGLFDKINLSNIDNVRDDITFIVILDKLVRAAIDAFNDITSIKFTVLEAAKTELAKVLTSIPGGINVSKLQDDAIIDFFATKYGEVISAKYSTWEESEANHKIFADEIDKIKQNPSSLRLFLEYILPLRLNVHETARVESIYVSGNFMEEAVYAPTSDCYTSSFDTAGRWNADIKEEVDDYWENEFLVHQ